MTPEQQQTATKVIKHSRWLWAPGMLDDQGGRVILTRDPHCVAVVHADQPLKLCGQDPEAVPDLTDDATGGAIQALLPKDFTVQAPSGRSGPQYWEVTRHVLRNPVVVRLDYRGATLAEACALALLGEV